MEDWYQNLSRSVKDTATEMLAKTDADPNVRCFTKWQMKRISNNYSTILGKGGFSVVYEGRLDDGRRVAVKQYNWRTQKKEFTKEVIIQSQFSHRNIVRLLGCCLEADTPTLVTEFVPNGNLSDLLHGNYSYQFPISLETRLQIAFHVAEALVYMHSSQTHPIIHGDVKPSNILLGENHMAKLCDFGISRLLCMDNDEYTTGIVMGSKGYVDPVFCQTGRLSAKSDVYSFGVVLLELMTRKKGFDDKKVCLAEIFARASREDNRHEPFDMFDMDIATSENMEMIEGVGGLALECLKFEVDERPEMKEVLERLWSLKRSREKKIQQLQPERRIVTLREIEVILQGSGFKRFITKANVDAIIGDPNLLSSSQTLRAKNSVLMECAMGKGYIGQLNGIPLVAIKISFEVDEGWKQLFSNEMIVQSRIKHWHVAKLFGCCLDHVDAPVLVYEYGKVGLHDALFGYERQRFESPLTCTVRLMIAIDAAEGLAHLHSLEIVHGDVRTANVLLDNFSGYKLEVPRSIPNEFPAKIAGYGTPRLYSKVRAQRTRFLAKNVSYKDPQFLNTGTMAKENDVYGFGVVLVELFTWKKVQSHDLNTEFEQLWDKKILDRCPHLEEIKSLSSWCLAPEVTERPAMAEIIRCLRGVLKDLRGENGSSCLRVAVDQRKMQSPPATSTI